MKNINEMTRPLGYKFGTKDGKLVGDREKDLKEWEEDTINRLKRRMDIEKLLKKLPEIFDKIPGVEKEEEKELPDWVKEFLEKNRPDPDRFKRLLPKKEDEGERFIPEIGPDRFNPDRFGPYFGPEKGPDRFLWPPEGWKNDPRYRPMPMPTWPPENWKNDPRLGPYIITPEDRKKYNEMVPEIGPYIIRPDDPPFDPEKDVQLLGDETSGLMEDSSGIKILGMKLQLQKVLSLDMIDKMEDMSPIEIEILYNDTFGKVS